MLNKAQPAEKLVKIQNKRLLNRKAAKKCRQKKKYLISKLIEENSILKKRINELLEDTEN